MAKRKHIVTLHHLRKTKISEAYSNGYNDGIRLGKEVGQSEGRAEVMAKFEKRREVAHVAALEASTKLANALGQTIEALSRAMQSDRGQL